MLVMTNYAKKIMLAQSIQATVQSFGPASVTVIWASPRFWLPHSKNPSDMGIPCNPNHNPYR